jgi:hypothetical protein
VKLLLYIDDKLFNELKLPDEEFETDSNFNDEENIALRKERVESYVRDLRIMFSLKLRRSKSFEVYLIAESKMKDFPIDIFL